MAADASGPAPSGLVARLRAAGCVFAEDEAALLVAAAAGDAVELERLTALRVSGEPLEHLLGWVDFEGARLHIGAGVFVPRRRTGLLVREAARLARPGLTVVDLCCGSGAVGAAVLARVPGVELYAGDIDPAAVRVARRNLDPDRVFEGDLFAALPARLRGRIDVLTANTPYVPTDAIATMPPEARLHEPPVALDGGRDGLDVQRRVAAEAPGWLRPGGAVVVEAGAAQAPTTARIFAAAGLEPRVIHSSGYDATVVVGVLSAV